MIGSEDEAKAWLTEQFGAATLSRLELLAELLVTENAAQNLIAAGTVPHLFQRHVADSAQLLRFVSRETAGHWLDLGSGAGFPGLVVAACRPDWAVGLVESRPLRVDWLQRAALALKLENVTVFGSRVERLETMQCDVISARAFAPLLKTLHVAARFSTSETLWLLPKGRSAQQELATAGSSADMFHVEQSFTDPDAGILVGQIGGKRGGKA
ncbi:16S rRNA (guanine(527)-N(7))-methyltransferase RsmG [Parablastomonas sp. CN1-191]|uniref:16S rRNA (guanine(527)-N(7))-methyltransferase RsmG n=1 Tax=Parablastomonas sp. CN1-191 TaxID=3400908 RepID=UPI003BF84F2B